MKLGILFKILVLLFIITLIIQYLNIEDTRTEEWSDYELDTTREVLEYDWDKGDFTYKDEVEIDTTSKPLPKRHEFDLSDLAR